MSGRDVHVHVWRAGREDEGRQLLFRDWLRESAEDRAHYEDIKRELASHTWDRSNDYAEAKCDVGAEILHHSEG